MQRLSGILRGFLISAPICITFVDVVGSLKQVTGCSMQPTLNPDGDVGDYVFLSRWSVRNFDLTRGAIYSLYSPKDPEQHLIKRVVGLEGDVVETLGYKQSVVRVPDGHCWVEGDKHECSLDSNLLGPVARAAMRTVSFVGHVEMDVEGGVAPSAMIVADVDGDGQRELVVGTESGHLYVFKGLQTQPLCHLTGLGMVTAVCCGPLVPGASFQLAVVSGNGLVHLLDWDGTGLNQKHSQRIPANVKTALLEDVDQDGQTELVVALTDRVVRVYRWADDSLRAISKCELMQQIGNISLNIESDGRPSVLVSQPGAAVVRLRYRSSKDDNGRECHSVDIDDVSQPVKLRPNVSCEVLGGLGDRPSSHTYAMCTLDGCLLYVRDKQVVWSTVLHHQLFGLTKMDITSDGSDEIIVSSWDGHTFIINQEAQSVQFLLEAAVTAFTAGLYGVCGANVPCLVYAAAGRLVLYHNVRLPVMVTETLTDTVAARAEFAGAGRLTPLQLQQLCRWCLYGLSVDTPEGEEDGGSGEKLAAEDSDGSARRSESVADM